MLAPPSPIYTLDTCSLPDSAHKRFVGSCKGCTTKKGTRAVKRTVPARWADGARDDQGRDAAAGVVGPTGRWPPRGPQRGRAAPDAAGPAAGPAWDGGGAAGGTGAGGRAGGGPRRTAAAP